VSVFSEVYAGHYDGLYSSKNYQSECDLIEEAIKRYATSKPLTLLDVGCGTGGHAIEMSQRGYAVTGFDLSQPMLDLAAEKSSVQLTTNCPRWLCADVRNFEVDDQFDLAIMMFAVVGYLTTNSDVLAGLRNIRRHLKPNALMICDFWSGPSVLAVRPVDRIREVQTQDGKVIRAASTTLDIAKHTADVKFKLWAVEKSQLVKESCETHHLRYFFPMEFELFLSNAGFELKSLSAFPSLDEALTNDSWNALAVCSAI
jgi:SAM-dependent methyltransferase